MIAFKTKRLEIRLIKKSDAKALDVYRNHEEYGRYTTTKPDPDFDMPASILKKLKRAAEKPKKYWPLVLVLKSSGKVIGDVRINADALFPTICELAYGINPEYWNKGYMTEAVKAVVDYCHDELKMHRVVIRSDARNKASWRIARKIGMHYEGTMQYGFITWRGFMPKLKTYASIRPDLIPKAN
jgi:ribosomal-protein-alanine N-acetyltransferase